MAAKESRSINTLNEFLEWAAQFNDGQYLFRGAKKEHHEMVASAARRLYGSDGNNPSKLLKLNKRLIEDARSRGHDQKDGRSLSELELLAELQHFGAATCLIDFTRSTLIALWFACEGGTEDENNDNGKVFAVCRDIRLKTVTSDLIQKPIGHFFQVDQKNQYQLYQWEPKLQNSRIIAQRSVFVFGGASIKVEAECVILSRSKHEILKSLKELSDIEEASIYPDFDGFARLHAHNKPYIEADAITYFLRGVEAHQRDDFDDAIAYYDEIISTDPENTSILADIYYNRGTAYSTIGEYDRAIEDLTKAIELRPNDPRAYYNRGGTYIDKQFYELAIKDFDKAINLNPDDSSHYLLRGVAHIEKHDYELAASDFSNAIKLNPSDAGAYNGRGTSHYRNADFDSAIADFSQAIQLNPALAQAYCNRGEAWLHLREWEKAKSDLMIARDKGLDIIASFRKDYENVEDFEQKNDVQLPEEIAAMLTPSAG